MNKLIIVSILFLLNACKKSDALPENKFLGSWESVTSTSHWTSNGQHYDAIDVAEIGTTFIFENQNKVIVKQIGLENHTGTFIENTVNQTISIDFDSGFKRVYNYEFISSSELKLEIANAEFMRINTDPKISSGSYSITYKKK